MKLRRRGIAGFAGLGDDLPAPDGLAAFDIELAVIGIGGHEAVGMTDQNKVAIATHFIARIDDNARLRRLDGGAFRQRDIDAVIGAAAITFGDAAARWPAE